MDRHHGLPLDMYDADTLRKLGLLDESGASDATLAQALRAMIGNPAATGPQRRRIGLASLTRDLTVGTANAGGYLTGTSMGAFETLMRRWSILGQAGCSVVGPFDSSTVIPRAGTRPAASWLASEGASIPQNEGTFAQAAVTPHYVAVYMKASRQVIVQGGKAVDAIINELAGDAVGRAIDEAIVAGAGAAGAPTGIVNTSGISTQSGTSLAHAGLLNMREFALLQSAQEQNLIWLGHPTVQATLAGRERHAGGGKALWDDNGILGRPAYATTAVPAATLVCCDPSRITVAHFSGGIGVEVDPYTDFRSGKVAFRIIVAVDFAFTPSASFAVATSIT